MINETIGLQLEADTRAWEAAFSAAERKASELGAEVGKATASTAKLGDALRSAGGKGTTAFGELLRKQQESIKALEALGKQVEPSSNLHKNITELAIKFNLVGGAIKLAKDYFTDLFSRAKMDPALAAVERLRQTTTEWSAEFRHAIDTVVVGAITGIEAIADKLGQLAYGVTGETNTARGAIDVSAKESAKRHWEAMGRTFVPRGVAGPDMTPTEDLLDYQTLEQGYRSQFTQRTAAGAGASPMRFFAEQKAIADKYGWAPHGGGHGGGRDRGPNLAGVAGSFFGGGVNGAGWGFELEEQTTRGGIFGRLGGLGGISGVNPLKQISELKKALSDAAMKGRLEEIKDETTAIGGSLAALTGGLTAAVDAAISGNESIGRAFLKGSAQVLKSIALKATGMAAFEAAMAWVEPLESARHLTAAGKLLAAAAITGALSAGASGLAGAGGGGGYGGRGSSAATGGYASRPTSGPGGGGGNTYVININGFYGDEKQAIPAIHRGLEKAEQARRVRPSSSRVVTYGAAA